MPASQSTASPVRASATVRAEWTELNGRHFILERVGLKDISAQWRRLPLMSQSELPGGSRSSRGNEAQIPTETAGFRRDHSLVTSAATLPAHPVLEHLKAPDVQLAEASHAPMEVAKNEKPETGLLIDYDFVPSSATDWNFDYYSTYVVGTDGDSDYGDVYLTGTTTFSDGCVIKFLDGASLHLQGPVVCTGGDTVYFTSVNDDSVGDSTSSGSPSLGCYGTALDIDGSSSGVCDLESLQINYATCAIQISGGASLAAPHTINNCSFSDCSTPFSLLNTWVSANGGAAYTSDGGDCEPFIGSTYVFTGNGLTFDSWGWSHFATDSRTNATPLSVVRLAGSSVSSRGGGGSPTNSSGSVVVILNPPTVTVAATTREAFKGTSTNGVFTITRDGGDQTQPLTVHFALGGSANTNADYLPIGTSAVILANNSNVQVTVQPRSQSGGTGIYQSSVALGLTGTLFDPYTVAKPAMDVVYVADPSVSPPAPVPPPAPSPPSGVPTAIVTITGADFSATPSSNIVYFGAVRAAVLAATTNSLTVSVPVGATYAPLTVSANGLTACANTPFLITFPGAGALSSTSLTNRLDIGVGGGPLLTAIGDLDGDGKPDVVVVHAFDGTVWIFRNTSTNGALTTNSFAEPIVLQVGGSSGLWGLALADLDGDGRLDILMANWANNSVSVLQNLSTPGSLATNSFGPQLDFPVGTYPERIAVADLDGDGHPDIVVSAGGSGNISLLGNLGAGGPLTTLSFAPEFELVVGTGSDWVKAVAIADLDGDGNPDIVAVNHSGAGNSVVFRNLGVAGRRLGTNSFASGVSFSGGGESVAIGDLDGDGKPDLVAANWGNGAIYILRNTASSGTITTNSFAPKIALSSGGATHAAVIADLDGDGKPDIALVTEGGSHLSLIRNISTNGTLTTNSFAARLDFSSGWNAAGISVGDLDGDGRPDIVFGNTYDSSMSIYRNIAPVLPPRPSTLALSASTNSAVYGQPVVFTASVTGSNGTPAGTVVFNDGSSDFATNLLSGGTTTLTNSSLSLGEITVTASYSGDGIFGPSTNSIVLTNNPANTTVALTTSVSPTVFGQSVTFTATVTPVDPASGTPTGTATFSDGATTWSARTLNGSGQATITGSSLSVGAHPITAVYNGDGNFNTSTSGALTQTVNQTSTTVAVSSSANASAYGQSVTFTATVNAASPGSGTPTGTVTFNDGTDTLGTGSLSSGQATFTTASLAPGSRPITAVYGGDLDFLTNTSPVLTQNVFKAGASSAISSSLNPSILGDSVVFTVTAWVWAPSSGAPTGPIVFFDGTSPFGTNVLADGTASWTNADLLAGVHSITAVYGGDDNFNGFISPTLSQTVHRDSNSISSATTLVSSSNPSVFGQPVILLATVAGTNGTPTGTIVFSDGANALSTNALAGDGTASFTNSVFATGTNYLTAAYSGDPIYDPSTATADLVVNKRDTTTVLTSNPSPPVRGSSNTFTVTVAAVSPPPGPPPGTVPTGTVELKQEPFLFLQNGDFENTTFQPCDPGYTNTSSYAAPGWLQSGDTNATWTEDGTVHSGSRSLAAQSDDFGYISQQIPVIKDQSYQLSFWVRIGSGDSNSFQVFWNGQQLYDGENLPQADWTNMQFTVTAPASVLTELKFALRMYGGDSIYLDDITLNGEFPTNPAPFDLTATLDSSSVATFNAADVEGTSRRFTATYSGDTNFSGSDSGCYSFDLLYDAANMYVNLPGPFANTNTVKAYFFGGLAENMAILVNNTNFDDAEWVPFNGVPQAFLGATDGVYQVWFGVKGFNGVAYWFSESVTLDTAIPTVQITAPTNTSSFYASRVNVQGNFAATLFKQITVNGVPAFIAGTNFNALNVPLSPGTNVITATAEDLAGNIGSNSITVIALTNSDGSVSDPVQLQATPTVGFSPLTVTFQIVSNSAPGTFQQVLYDFNGDGITDFTTNNLDSITCTYTNGEYFPVVTIQTDAGLFSSSGGWNSTDPNRPKITIQIQPTQTTLANVTDPVDLKWVSPSNLYVLSGSIATLTEFDTNGNTIRSLSGLGSNPSGFDVDASGNVYLAVTSSNQVWKFNPTAISFVADTNFGLGGFIGATNGVSGTNNSEFNAPYDVAVSPDGQEIAVSDSGNHRIQRLSSAGVFIDSFGQQGTSLGQFNTPKGLAYDVLGYLYIADSGNSRIVLALGSAVADSSGTAGTSLGQFQGPVSLCTDSRGIYVADTGNNRLQIFDPIKTGTGVPATPFAPRLALSTILGLSQPQAVAVVSNPLTEKAYIADTGNNRVVLVTLPADNPTPAWAAAQSALGSGNIMGAIPYFSSSTASKYRQLFLSIGTADLTPIVSGIPDLTPVFIGSDTAEYRFDRQIQGFTITFPVEFTKENGVWKILDY